MVPSVLLGLLARSLNGCRSLLRVSVLALIPEDVQLQARVTVRGVAARAPNQFKPGNYLCQISRYLDHLDYLADICALTILDYLYLPDAFYSA